MTNNVCKVLLCVAAVLAPSAPALASPAAAPSASPVPSPTPGPAVGNGGVAAKTTISSDEMQSSNAQNTYDAIKDVPGVTQADAKAGGGSDNLQVRGIHLGANTGYRLDGGLPMVNNIILSTEDKEQVQVLKGAGALEYGIASPAGIINYVLKRATKAPVTSISLTQNGFGQVIGNVDVGRQFGRGDQFGVRVNLAGGETGGYVNDSDGTRWLGATTADWRTKKARVRFNFERFGINVVEQAALIQNKAGKDGRIELPPIPDPYNLLSGVWARAVGVGQNISLRANYQFDDAVSLIGEVGRSDADRPRRAVGQIGNYNLVTGAGTETVTLIRDQAYVNKYANIEARLRASPGRFLENQLTVGFTRNERLFNGPVNSQATYSQNLFAPVVLPAPLYPTGPTQFLPQNSFDNDYFFTDSLVIEKRFRITGGLREINYSAADALAGGKSNQSTTSFLAPAIGGVFDLAKSLALYGSYVKSLEETGQAPINSKNAYAVLPPAQATQKEVGVRVYGGRGFAASVGYFTIDRANATTDPITKIYGLNGTNRFEGIETTVAAQLGAHWSISAGGQSMNATQRSPDDHSIDGKIPENVPKLSGSVGLGYRPSFIPGLELSGGLQYVGSRQINPQDQGTIPSVTTSNVGASYVTRINDRRIVVNLSCRNLADKRYYSSAVNGALGIAAPRTVSLTVRIASAR